MDASPIDDVDAHHSTHTAAETRRNDTYAQQYLATLSATLPLLGAGFALGWSSPALPRLHAADTPVPMTRDQGAWIVAFMEVGVLIAAIPAVWLMDRFGRRVTIIIGIVPLAISWPLIATARSAIVLGAARLLAGLTFGLCLAVVPIYLGEIAAVRIRGRIAVAVTVTVQLGVLLAYAIGTVVPFATLAWLSLAPLALFVVAAALWLPETPYWLLRHRCDDDAALRCLRRLCGRIEVSTEWRTLRDELEMRSVHGTVADIVRGRGNRRALTVIVGVTAIQVLCGSLTTIAYAETIFAGVLSGGSDSGGGADKDVAGRVSIVFGSVQLVAATVSALAVDHVGRRPLLLGSVIGTTVCNTLVGAYLHLDTRYAGANEGLRELLDSIAWLPVATIMLGVVFYFSGLATVIFALLAELLPAHLQRVGSAVYTLVSGALIFAANKLFQVVSDEWGRDVAFWGFAACGVAFAPFVWAFVPETRGRELEAIREELATGGRRWRKR